MADMVSIEQAIRTISNLWTLFYGVVGVAVILSGALIEARLNISFLKTTLAETRDNLAKETEARRQETAELRAEARQERREVRDELTKISNLVQRIAERLKIQEEKS